MAYKAILFDMDWTLVRTDSRFRHYAVAKPLRHFGINISKEEMDALWYEGMRHAELERLGVKDLGAFFKIFGDCQGGKYKNDIERRKRYTAAYQDVTVLPYLRDLGYKMGLVTTAPSFVADMETGLINESLKGESKTFAFDSVKASAQKPTSILECLNELNVDGHEAVYVGDALTDIEAAKAAGVFDILLKRHDVSDRAKPSVVVYSLHELKDFLETH
jgi:HAD superfamily hydrolase (TIGR01549 family)